MNGLRPKPLVYGIFFAAACAAPLKTSPAQPLGDTATTTESPRSTDSRASSAGSGDARSEGHDSRSDGGDARTDGGGASAATKPPADGTTVASDTVYISERTADSVALTVDVAESVTPGVISFREGPTDSATPFCPPGIPAGTPTPTVRWCPRVAVAVRVWVRVVDQRPLGSVISPARATATTGSGIESPAPSPGAGPNASTRSRNGDPELPRALPRLPTQFDKTIRVPAGGDLQRAINRATAGTEILLPKRSTFVGPFRLPDRGDDGWVRIATDISAPAARIDTASEIAASLATLTAEVDVGTVIIDNAGGGWSLDLLNITHDGETTNALVYVHDPSGGIPDGILIDRSWLHRRSPQHMITRCVIANGSNLTVRRSALTSCTRPGQQTQGIAQWNTPGPTLIEDNLIMAGSQGYLCGGAGGVRAHPSDITIRLNHLHTPTSWQGRYHNLAPLETKDCHRVLVEATVIDGGEFGILLKSSSQGGACGRGCGTEHVTIRNTIIRNTIGGVNALRTDSEEAVPMHDILFDNVLFENIGPSSNGWRNGEGRLFQILGAPPQLTIRNVTFDSNGHSYLYVVNGPTTPQQDFAIDNVVVAGSFRYKMLVQQPSAFRRHYATYRIGSVFGGCGGAPPPMKCIGSIPGGAGVDRARLNAAIAGVVR